MFAMVKKLRLLAMIVSIGAYLLMPVHVMAAAISQGYNATQTIPAGAVVSLENNQLTLATGSNATALLGVVVTGSAYLLNIDSAKTVQVVTSGKASTLVSDINGEIKSGDKLAPSPIAGVAMKATESGKVLGIAAADFGSNQSLQTEQIKDKFGKVRTVHIGSVIADINIVDYQLATGGTSALVAGLQSVAGAASGKSVTPLKAILAAVVLILALAVSVIVLYSGVSSSIRSIGRNPLSKKFVVQGLVQVIIAVFIIMIAAFSVVYIIIGS